MEWGASGKKKHLLIAHNFCMEEVNDLVDKAFGGTEVVNSIVGNNSEVVSAINNTIEHVLTDTGPLIKKNVDAADGADLQAEPQVRQRQAVRRRDREAQHCDRRDRGSPR